MSHQTRWLYIALLFYRNGKTGDAFPSYNTIRELTRLTRTKISEGFKELLSRGWLANKRRQYGHSTYYEVCVQKKANTEGEIDY